MDDDRSREPDRLLAQYDSDPIALSLRLLPQADTEDRPTVLIRSRPTSNQNRLGTRVRFYFEGQTTWQ